MMNLPEYLSTIQKAHANYREAVTRAADEMDNTIQSAHDDFFGTILSGNTATVSDRERDEWKRLK